MKICSPLGSRRKTETAIRAWDRRVQSLGRRVASASELAGSGDRT